MSVASRTVQAIPVSPGIAIGRVMRIHRDLPPGTTEYRRIDSEAVTSELQRFEAARSATREQLTALRDTVQNKLRTGGREIFDAHLLLVDDRMMLQEVTKLINEEHCTAEFAVSEATEHFLQAFRGLDDDYLKERAADLRDVSNRLLRNLAECESEQNAFDDRRIIIASNLTPSETVGLDRDRVLGFAVETGSVTSHTAILARSLMLPAVVGVPMELLDSLSAADQMIIDGFSGKVIINPDERTIEAYRLKRKERGEFYSQLMEESNRPPETSDGLMIPLAANLDADQSYGSIRRVGGYGVGLFRTEFLFMDPEKLPGEDEQYEVYKKLLVEADNEPVTIRTMDIGGDKFSSNIIRSVEQNPFLGLRGLRLCLKERRDLFDAQLRALLRAGVHGNLRVMLPMVSSVLEVREVWEIIGKLQSELTARNEECVSRLSLGVMIETPAAALLAERLAPLVAFFSIGTNDLVQYTMAVDRGNERVAHLYRPSHPAILRLIAMTVQAARKNNIFVSVCGQTAEMPEMVPLLIGLGVQELSMSPGLIPLVRRLIRGLSMSECAELAEKAQECDHASEALELSLALLKLRVPEIIAI